MDFPRSFWISRESSCCESSRLNPRSVPSTSRRYRSFSPSFISQYVLTILQSVIAVKRNNFSVFIWLEIPTRRLGSGQAKKTARKEGADVAAKTLRTGVRPTGLRWPAHTTPAVLEVQPRAICGYHRKRSER